MLAASQKQFDVLVFWSLDRLSAGIVKTLGYLEQLRVWGIGWRASHSHFGTQATEWLTVSFCLFSRKRQANRILVSTAVLW